MEGAAASASDALLVLDEMGMIEPREMAAAMDRGLGFGCFDHAGTDGNAAAFSKALKHAGVSNYETAGPEFVRRFVANGLDGETVRVMVADFVAAEVPAGADGQIVRAAERIGLIMAAGEMAAAMGVTPWREGAAREAAAWALKQWIEGRGGVEPADIRQAVEAGNDSEVSNASRVDIPDRLHNGEKSDPGV